MSYQVATARIKRQSKIFHNWCPWPLSLTEARELIACAWEFDGWGEFIGIQKNNKTRGDQRINRLNEKQLSDDLRSTLTASLCDLSNMIKHVNPFADVLYPAHAEMLIDAFYGIKEPHIVIAQTDMGDWILSKPARWSKFYDEFYVALDSQDNDTIYRYCVGILNDCPDFLEAMVELAYIAIDDNDTENAIRWSTAAYDICQQAMGSNFDPLTEEVNWRFINNRPFHRSLLVYSKVLEIRGQKSEAKKILRSLLFMNPSDNLGIRGHPLVSQNAFRESRRREKQYHQRYMEKLADMNQVDAETMEGLLALANEEAFRVQTNRKTDTFHE